MPATWALHKASVFCSAEQMLSRTDVGFLFVGRGSDAQRLAADARAKRLQNVLFELATVIQRENVGRVTVDGSVASLHRLAEELLSSFDADTHLAARCKSLFARLFSAESAVKQVAAALQTAPQAIPYLPRVEFSAPAPLSLESCQIER